MYIINIFKQILSIFLNKKEPEQEETEQENPYLNDGELSNLSVTIKEDGSLELICSWNIDYQSPELSMALGTMLKMLTNGNYDGLIMESLKKSYDSHDDINHDFVSNVMKIWKDDQVDQIAEALQNLPVVSPLHTFGESNIRGAGPIL